jgi:hypothetical protein
LVEKKLSLTALSHALGKFFSQKAPATPVFAFQGSGLVH